MAWNLTGNIKGPPSGAAAEARLFTPDQDRLTLSADTATVSVVTVDPGYTRTYTRGSASTPAAGWPLRHGRGTEGITSVWSRASSPTVDGHRPIRFDMDGDRFAIKFDLTSVNRGFEIIADGRPVMLAPVGVPTTGVKWLTCVFEGGAKNRRIEVLADFRISDVYTNTPYKLWKPEPFSGPNIAVLGGSYVAAITAITVKNYGMYQGLAPLLGVEEVVTGGFGGTGYIQGGTVNYAARLAAVTALNPDVLIVHGGGANDLYYASGTNAEIITAATTLFQNARAALPDAKLVFVEGFAPPGLTPATYNPNYIAIRAGVQSALTATGVYYIDVATTDPWLDASNTTPYIANDGVHLTPAGHAYVRNRLATPLRRILRDRGPLLNQLV